MAFSTKTHPGRLEWPHRHGRRRRRTRHTEDGRRTPPRRLTTLARGCRIVLEATASAVQTSEVQSPGIRSSTTPPSKTSAKRCRRPRHVTERLRRRSDAVTYPLRQDLAPQCYQLPHTPSTQ